MIHAYEPKIIDPARPKRPTVMLLKAATWVAFGCSVGAWAAFGLLAALRALDPLESAFLIFAAHHVAVPAGVAAVGLLVFRLLAPGSGRELTFLDKVGLRERSLIWVVAAILLTAISSAIVAVLAY